MERKLNKTEREVLRRLCEYKCEECREHEEECGTLQPHRIKRGNQGGRYTLRNIKIGLTTVVTKCFTQKKMA